MHEFQYIRVSESTDLAGLPELVKLCFNMEVDHRYFRWKYFDNPAGAVVAYIAVSDNQIAGFYGLIPEWYWMDGKRVKLFQSMDTMTHPSFRRLGLFVKLATMCFDDLRRDQPDNLIVGFPAPASHAGFVQKLNWTTLFYDRYWFCYSFIFNIFSFFGKKPNDLSFRDFDVSSTQAIEYFNHKKSIARMEKIVDAEIFKWKIEGNQHKHYKHLGIFRNQELIGIAVYHLDTPKSCHLVWLDFSNTADCNSQIFRALMDYLFSITGRRCIYTWGPQLEFQKRAFRRTGFLTNPFGRGPFCIPFPFIALAHGNFTQLSVWKEKHNYNFQGIMLD